MEPTLWYQARCSSLLGSIRPKSVRQPPNLRSAAFPDDICRQVDSADEELEQ